MSVGLFTTITGLGRKNWRGGFSQERLYFFNSLSIACALPTYLFKSN